VTDAPRPAPPPALDALGPIPRDAEGPVFRAPWEAQAFALAVALHERGLFTWREWAAQLAAELAAAHARGEPDDGSRYYHAWLAALERIVLAKGLLAPAELTRRREELAGAGPRPADPSAP